MILSLNSVSKSFGTDTVLDNISFGVEEGEKIALVGVNGAGKSTLFKIITGELSSDGGEVIIPKDKSVGYFAQDLRIDSGNSIYDELLLVFKPLLATEARLRELELSMKGLEGNALDTAMTEYGALSHEFENMGGYGYQSQIRGVIKGLGFTPEEAGQSVEELSGGQKTRVALGKLLLSRPDILLLDEPTNHLDIGATQWLEEYIRSFKGTVIVISHDRYFLDRVASKVVELERTHSKVYFGNYTYYVAQKATDRENEMRAYENRQREIKHQEEVIKKLREFNREKSIKRAESREKMLEKIERIERPEALPDKMRLEIKPAVESGGDVLELSGVSMSFSAKELFTDVYLSVKKGERIAIIGDNGIGKTTLIRIVTGRLTPTFGEVKLGAKVKIGYYDQEQAELNENKTIIEEITDIYPTLQTGYVRNVLAAFVFKGDDVFKPISSLSGGEKGRVALAKLMLSGANFLVLDEPTNHLDLESKEILENALKSYTGTVLCISHDRYFINAVAEKTLEMTKTGLVTYLGNYDYYLEKKQAEVEAVAINEVVSESKTDWKRQKSEQAAIRKRENELNAIEKEINELEEEIEVLNEQLDLKEIYTDAVKAREVYEQKEEKEERLMLLYEKYDELS